MATIGALTALATRTPSITPVGSLDYPATAVHRLGKIRAPENTLAAARTSVGEQAGVILECDVHALRDGTLVVIHDDTIDRVAAGGKTGRVKDMSVSQWKSLRIKHPTGGAPAPALFFDELLEEYGDSDQVLLVEMKAPQARDQCDVSRHR